MARRNGIMLRSCGEMLTLRICSVQRASLRRAMRGQRRHGRQRAMITMAMAIQPAPAVISSCHGRIASVKYAPTRRLTADEHVGIRTAVRATPAASALAGSSPTAGWPIRSGS